ncbi:helix-turn-helix domain-containing protein [Mucilaginibacter endophyticus]|uniref:helix-turn-helix domain-containing protein n=1 Tax=Mucilaginibacter endophyticus TaxID=2675003 RepID=UPI000E0DAA28|nr:helix-turn-helix domain-containing protein [Mucilaginibacter endophyticus]
MNVEIITKEDLQAFRLQLLHDINALLNTKKDIQKEWLKGAEVRQLLKVSPGTLQNLRTGGRLSYSKVGGTYYYRHQDIIKLLESSREAFR